MVGKIAIIMGFIDMKLELWINTPREKWLQRFFCVGNIHPRKIDMDRFDLQKFKQHFYL